MRKPTDRNFYKVKEVKEFYDLKGNEIDYYLKDIRNYKGKWLGTDNPERWEQNKQLHKDHPDIEWWENNPIEYEFNNYNFRTPDDFNTTDEGIIFLGCSHTAGVALHWYQTWVSYVVNHYGLKAWNLAIGGMGIQTAYRNLVLWTQKERRLKAKSVCLLIPHFYRWEFYGQDSQKWNPLTAVGLPGYVPGEFKGIVGMLNDLLFSDRSTFWLMRSQLDAIKAVCDRFDMNLYVNTTLPVAFWEDPAVIPVHARDFSHCSPFQQEFIGLRFIEMIENKKVYDPEVFDFFKMAWEVGNTKRK